jgi:hypothetical protein
MESIGQIGTKPLEVTPNFSLKISICFSVLPLETVPLTATNTVFVRCNVRMFQEGQQRAAFGWGKHPKFLHQTPYVPKAQLVWLFGCSVATNLH